MSDLSKQRKEKPPLASQIAQDKALLKWMRQQYKYAIKHKAPLLERENPTISSGPRKPKKIKGK